MEKLILKNWQSPGDILMLAYAVKGLHESWPGRYRTDVRTPFNELFRHNPYVQVVADDDPEARLLTLGYPSVHLSNQYPVQFVTGFTGDLGRQLGVPIRPAAWTPGLFLSGQEMTDSPVQGVVGRHVPYWVVANSHKTDFTAKAWAADRWQALVDEFPDVWFVRVGAAGRNHVNPPLAGDNVVDLVGRTSLRELAQVVYHAFGVVGGVSFPMHLAYAVPPNPRFKRRPSIVLAGGREPSLWAAGPGAHVLHAGGMLPCCAQGGCWRARAVALNDGDVNDKSLCELPVLLNTGQTVPRCMEMIAVEDVARLIEKHMSQLDYEPAF